MRRSIAFVLALVVALAVAGCNSDVKEVRLDVTQVARLARAYSAMTSHPGPPPSEVRQMPAERLNDLGVILERRGMLDRAEQHYRMAVERKPDFARAWVNLGNVLRLQGRNDQAIQSYRRAMAEDPALFEAVNNFADLCADTGQCVQEALSLLGPALEKHPPEEYVGRDTLGKLLLREEHYPEAATAFRTSLVLTDPRDTKLRSTVLRCLAQAYRAMGQEDAARSAELRAAALM
jgi:tetratricopeptide (TPR) repeat protein